MFNIYQESQRGAYWRIGVPIIHLLRKKTQLHVAPGTRIVFSFQTGLTQKGSSTGRDDM